jgi:hypothetical protein
MNREEAIQSLYILKIKCQNSNFRLKNLTIKKIDYYIDMLEGFRFNTKDIETIVSDCKNTVSNNFKLKSIKEIKQNQERQQRKLF